jgi:hypothetical protein
VKSDSFNDSDDF